MVKILTIADNNMIKSHWHYETRKALCMISFIFVFYVSLFVCYLSKIVVGNQLRTLNIYILQLSRLLSVFEIGIKYFKILTIADNNMIKKYRHYETRQARCMISFIFVFYVSLFVCYLSKIEGGNQLWTLYVYILQLSHLSSVFEIGIKYFKILTIADNNMMKSYRHYETIQALCMISVIFI
jgi:hypothetical protein